MYIILASDLENELLSSMASSALNKHQQKTETTRRKLLAAAQRIFARDGFEAARIDDIASEAGHTRGAFYANFKSKEDLFLVLLEERAAIQVNKLRETLENCSGEEERMERLRNYYVSRATDRQWSILTLEFKLYAFRHGKLRAKLARAHRSIKAKMKLEDIRLLLPSKFLRGPETRELQRTLLEGILQGLVLEHAYDPTAVSSEQIEKGLGQLFDAVVNATEL